MVEVWGLKLVNGCYLVRLDDLMGDEFDDGLPGKEGVVADFGPYAHDYVLHVDLAEKFVFVFLDEFYFDWL